MTYNNIKRAFTYKICRSTMFVHCTAARPLLKRIGTTGLSRKEQSAYYISPKVGCACTWLSPPRSGPSPHLHNHSCHHLVSCDICSLPSPYVEFGVMIATGRGIRGGGRDNGFGGGGWLAFGGSV